jgi:hypothetical protein
MEGFDVAEIKSKYQECPDKFFAALGDMHDAELEFFGWEIRNNTLTFELDDCQDPGDH